MREIGWRIRAIRRREKRTLQWEAQLARMEIHFPDDEIEEKQVSKLEDQDQDKVTEHLRSRQMQKQAEYQGG